MLDWAACRRGGKKGLKKPLSAVRRAGRLSAFELEMRNTRSIKPACYLRPVLKRDLDNSRSLARMKK